MNFTEFFKFTNNIADEFLVISTDSSDLVLPLILICIWNFLRWVICNDSEIGHGEYLL